MKKGFLGSTVPPRPSPPKDTHPPSPGPFAFAPKVTGRPPLIFTRPELGPSAPSPADGPFGGPTRKHNNVPEQVMARLVRVCAGVTSSSKQPQSPSLVRSLSDLRGVLEEVTAVPEADRDPNASFASLAQLSPEEKRLHSALLEYVFQTLSLVLKNALPQAPQGLSTEGKQPSVALVLSDAALEHTFTCLSLLAVEWWPAFRPPETQSAPKRTKSAFSLLFELGLMFLERTLRGHMDSKATSPESLAALCNFLFNILRPRARATCNDTAEGDDVPTLDSIEAEAAPNEEVRQRIETALPKQVYPPAELCAAASRPELDFYLQLRRLISVCCTLITPRPEGTDSKLKVAALRLMRASICTWVVGDTLQPAEDELMRSVLGQYGAGLTPCPQTNDHDFLPDGARLFGPTSPISLAAARKFKARLDGHQVAGGKQVGGILPETVSRLTLLLVSSGKIKSGERSVPAPVATLALDTLRSLLVFALNDAALAQHSPDDEETLTRVNQVVLNLADYSHPSAAAQLAMIRYACSMISECPRALVQGEKKEEQREGVPFRSVQSLVRWLVDLSAPSRSKPVVDTARAAILRVLSITPGPSASSNPALLVSITLAFELQSSLQALGTQVRGKQEDALTKSCQRIQSILSTAVNVVGVQSVAVSAAGGLANALISLLSTDFNLWLSGLISTLAQNHAHVVPGSTDGSVELVLSDLSAAAGIALSNTLTCLGRTIAQLTLITPLRRAGLSPLPLILSLLSSIQGATPELDSDITLVTSQVSLLIAERVLAGASEALHHGSVATLRTKARKVASKLAGELAAHTTMVVSYLFESNWNTTSTKSVEGEGKQEGATPTTALNTRPGGALAVAPSATQAEVVHEQGTPLDVDSEGLDQFEADSILDVSYVRPALLSSASKPSNGSGAKAVQRTQEEFHAGVGMLLPLLFTHASSLAGPEYVGAFVDVSYNMVRGLASLHPSARDASTAALRTIAYNTGYTDLRMMVLDNADYIISRAVTALRKGVPPTMANNQIQAAAQAGPLVLVELVRILGSEAVVHIHDAVDDLLDSLDNFHGYPDYVAGITSVLNGVVEVVASKPLPEDQPVPVEPGQRQARSQPSRTKQVRSIAALLRSHTNPGVQADDSDDESEMDPAFVAQYEESKDEFKDPKREDPEGERLKEIVEAIMDRAIPLLAHPAAVLRVQALRLLAGGALSLSRMNKWTSALPLMTRGWPYMLLRLSEEASQVSLEALSTLGTWATIAPDFLARRFADEAWPKLRRLVESLVAVPDSSKGMDVGTHDPHARGRRRTVMVGVMEALAKICQALGPRMDQDVAWSLCCHPTFLTALTARQDPGLYNAAVSLFRALTKVNLGAVWASLSACAATDLPVWDSTTCVPHAVRLGTTAPLNVVLV